MEKFEIISIISFIFTSLGLVAAIITGFLGVYIASMIIIVILVFIWSIWITLKILSMSKIIAQSNRTKTIVDITPTLSDKPFYHEMKNHIHFINTPQKKIKIPASFLNWRGFTILFWVYITDEFFNSHNNRYLFSYTTNPTSASKYPNAFFLGIKGGSLNWRFVIKGEKPDKETLIHFSSAHNLLGWKLFSIRWQKEDFKLDFTIDAGHVFRETKTISEDFWPKPTSDFQFHLGGWQDTWHGGLSILKFFNFRIFQRYIGNSDLETLFDNERKFIINA